MKRGRISVLTLLVIAGLVGLAAILAFSTTADTAESATVRFMDALARGDSKALAQVTFIEDETEAEIEKKWAESCDYNKYYRFKWVPKATNTLTEKTAVATISLFALGQNEADYRLPLVKKDNKWKVDIAVVDRNFFPSLPK
jgi:Protein of unknown function (DUF2950)